MSARPLRVTHVIGSLSVGGAETWVMELLRAIPPETAHQSVLVHKVVDSRFAREAAARGVEVVHVGSHRDILRYSVSLFRVLRSRVRPDIVHSHVHHFSGAVLAIARLANVPGRVATSHSDTRTVEQSASLLRIGYLSAQSRLLDWGMTCGTAVSGRAGEALFGKRWNRDPRLRTAYCGIPLTRLSAIEADPTFRDRLGIPRTAAVLGQVGRLDPVKNHRKTLHVLRALLDRGVNAHLVIAGSGQAEQGLRSVTKLLRLEANVHFLGLRDDVAELMISVIDCLLMPSLHEGLPVTLMEAQATGLPVVLSDTVAGDLDAPDACLVRLPLSLPDSIWADSVQSLLAARRRRPAESEMSIWPFSIEASVQGVLQAYRAALQVPR